MRRLFLRMRNGAATPIKGALDRRYARRPILDDIAFRLSVLEDGMRRVEAGLTRIEKLDAAFDALLAVDEPGEFRWRILESHRLAAECSKSIEHLSQQGILLRRDLDDVLGRTS